jgi:hypothetical protein
MASRFKNQLSSALFLNFSGWSVLAIQAFDGQCAAPDVAVPAAIEAAILELINLCRCSRERRPAHRPFKPACCYLNPII